jgi:hypothetical protein
MNLKEKWSLIVLLVIVAVLIFWRINDGYVAFTDELLFEEASYRMAFGSDELQMSRLNETLIPINEGKVWLEKAPLYFWLTAPVFWLFNLLKSIYPLKDEVIRSGEFVYPWIRRFWTDVAGVVMVFFVYKISQLLVGNKGDPLLRQSSGRVWLPLSKEEEKKEKDNPPQPPLGKGGGNTVGLLAGFLLLASPLFLATTKSASLDMVATAFMTTAVYFYLKSKASVVNNTQSLIDKKNKETPPTLPLVRGGTIRWKYPILCGVFIGLGLMTRSFLALTPLALMLGDQLVTSFQL